MYCRHHKTAKSSANKSDAPAANQFAPRRFVVQPQAEQTPQNPDLQAQSADSLLNLPIFRNSPLTSPPPIQMKLTIGQPGDKYEQEADKVAADVVQRINAPEKERVQRQELPEDEDQLQIKPMVQSLPGEDGMATSLDLEASIQQAQSSGQPLAKNIRAPMEQAFGADFSGVQIHTGSQADQLSESIQTKAFTTGQDVFFRQGAYNLGSRVGQELIAHELTHVVQQNGGAVQRSPQPQQQWEQHSAIETPLASMGERVITAKGDKIRNCQDSLMVQRPNKPGLPFLSSTLGVAPPHINMVQRAIKARVMGEQKTTEHKDLQSFCTTFDIDKNSLVAAMKTKLFEGNLFPDSYNWKLD